MKLVMSLEHGLLLHPITAAIQLSHIAQSVLGADSLIGRTFCPYYCHLDTMLPFTDVQTSFTIRITILHVAHLSCHETQSYSVQPSPHMTRYWNASRMWNSDLASAPEGRVGIALPSSTNVNRHPPQVTMSSEPSMEISKWRPNPEETSKQKMCLIRRRCPSGIDGKQRFDSHLKRFLPKNISAAS